MTGSLQKEVSKRLSIPLADILSSVRSRSVARGRIAVESVPSRHDGFETSRRRRSQEPERHSFPELVQSGRFRTRRGVDGKASPKRE